ncbi:MAG: tetratricopeptide repeat protein [Betaproteobacteria bacterium]
MADPRDQRAVQEIAASVQRGDLAGARAQCAAFLESVRDVSRQAPVRIWLGLIEQRSGSIEAALAQYEIARQADRRNPQLTLQLGLAHFALQHWDEAERFYREAIRLEPRLPVAHYNLGVLLQHKRELAAARRAFESALVHQPRFPEALNNLGNVLLALREPTGAERCYRQAIEVRPTFANAHHGLGLMLIRQSRNADALKHLRIAVEHDGDFFDAWLDLAECQAQSGDVGAAKGSVAAVLARDPQHAVARFRQAVYEGGQTPESAPTELVERLYAGMAATFDEHLVERLGYKIPALLVESIKPWLAQFEAANARKPFVVDLGCGTGLFGLQIRSSAARLVGVDLSASMLEVARKRGIYDELLESDLVSYLRAIAEPADLIAATDVLIYVGNLAPLFEQIAMRLSSCGAFVFSTETPDGLTEGMRLQPSGRYAHSVQYVEKLATASGLRVSERSRTVIRTENGAAVNGFMFVVEKPSAAVA